MKSKHIVQAAGGIVYRLRNGANPASDPVGSVEVCLVHRPKYDDWSWPKGKLENNESFRHAAVREIGEETGRYVQLGPYLTHVEYPLSAEGRKSRSHAQPSSPVKYVEYWMAKVIPGHEAARLSEAFGPVHRADIGEINDVVWMSVKEARRKLTHSTDKDVLAVFVDRLQEGALNARTMLLVRHAKAEPRKSWDGTEANRPITPRGAAAAYALDRELACYNPVRLITSPWTRCRQTVQVLSWQTRRSEETLDALTEDAFATDPEQTWREFSRLLDETARDEQGNTALVCMHRPVIGGMFNHMRRMCMSKTLEKMLPRKTPYMPTGTALAISVLDTPRGTQIIDIQKVHPIVY